jgi:uncharacterized protein (TIGR03000 family)
MYSLVLMAALSGSATAPATWGCHGCYGCYGCYGCGCYGSYRGCGCWGGCYGRVCYGCGCYGCGCYGCGCYGCHGCYGCCGCHGVPVKPAAPAAAPGTPPAGAPPVKKEDEVSVFPPIQPEIRPGLRNAPAYLVVNLPLEAKLTIDNEATASRSASRRFVSPILERGKEYTYTLRAEIMRDGEPVTTTETVTVRAGETTTVSLQFAPTTVTQK